MPRVKPKRKPIAYSCLYDRGFYRLYANNRLMSEHKTKKEALKEASRLGKLRPHPLLIAIKYKSVCTWRGESDSYVCKYWKDCVEAKGTTLTQPWGQKKLMLLKMKRKAKRPTPDPEKDKELDQFL